MPPGQNPLYVLHSPNLRPACPSPPSTPRSGVDVEQIHPARVGSDPGTGPLLSVVAVRVLTKHLTLLMTRHVAYRTGPPHFFEGYSLEKLHVSTENYNFINIVRSARFNSPMG